MRSIQELRKYAIFARTRKFGKDMPAPVTMGDIAALDEELGQVQWYLGNALLVLNKMEEYTEQGDYIQIWGNINYLKTTLGEQEKKFAIEEPPL